MNESLNWTETQSSVWSTSSLFYSHCHFLRASPNKWHRYSVNSQLNSACVDDITFPLHRRKRRSKLEPMGYRSNAQKMEGGRGRGGRWWEAWRTSLNSIQLEFREKYGGKKIAWVCPGEFHLTHARIFFQCFTTFFKLFNCSEIQITQPVRWL